MRVLVTGASGRIGRAIVVRLSREHEVLGLDRAPSSTADFIGEISDAALLKQALHRVDAVVHTAALHAPHVSLLTDLEFERINVHATQLLAETAAESGISRFVFTSTTALYGKASTPVGKAGWVDETLAPQPETIYHKTKIAAEDYLERYAKRTSIPVTVMRMSRCFPEPAPIMAAYRLHRGVDARDVADAHALALALAPPGFRKYVISGATPFDAADATALHKDAPTVIKQKAPELAWAFAQRGWALPQSIDRVYSPALAAIELGWTPKYGFMEVLKMLDEQSSETLLPRRHWIAKE
jgi:UDP-glucose 4-epimerase